jgi:predicted metal-binding membrane protein
MLMTVAMMSPSLAPVLWRYHRAMGGTRASGASLLMATAGYFGVWSVIGVAVYLLDVALEAAEQLLPPLHRAMPVVVAAVVLLAAAMQFTRWKARQLACWRQASTPGGGTTANAAAWRYGRTLGVHCALACAGPMAALLAVGMMDRRAMTLVTVVITLERVVPPVRNPQDTPSRAELGTAYS